MSDPTSDTPIPPVDQLYDAHEWIAMSLGEFVQFVTDSGNKESVIFRILKDETPPAGEQEFPRRLDVWLVPNGQVATKMLEIGCRLTNRIFHAQFEKGIVK